ncbi:PPC domain-containing protein [Cystobacter fuscus]|uniref:PPC domain-containing protein n=1 Tax=Cystobacter fuscus TaxID=43 RepID=UPI0002AE42BE|nr:PPC domain-containing protein [Cystobacter fuscus]
MKRFARKAFTASWLTLALVGCGPETSAPEEPTDGAGPLAEKGSPLPEQVQALASSCTGPSTLVSGTPVTNISASAGEWSCNYTLSVPSGATKLKFTTTSGSGDGDLYVKFGSEPTLGVYDCIANGSTNYETCDIPTAQAGTYHVKVYGSKAFSGLSLTGSFLASGPAGCTSTTTLSNGVPVNNIGVSGGSWSCIYSFYVPSGSTRVTFVSSGGSGDGDLYVRYGSSPNDTTYDCKSTGYGTDEVCTIDMPRTGVYYARLYGYGTFSGASLTGLYSLTGYPGCTTTSALVNNTPVSNVGAPASTFSCDYTLEVPSGATSLTFSGYGGSGASSHLYVKRGSAPTLSSYDCASTSGTSTCTFTSPQAGTWHVRVYNASSSGTLSGVTLRGTYVTSGGGGNGVLVNNQAVLNLSGATGSFRYWTITVPDGKSYLEVTAEGGSGDADLYVRKDLRPDESNYDCRSLAGGTYERCYEGSPLPGTYYVMLKGYSDYSGVQLKAVYGP